MSSKVMHIITGLNKGGAEMLLVSLLSSSIHQRSSLIVVSLTGGGPLHKEIEQLGIPVYSLGMRRGVPSVSSLFTLCRIVREFNPDVIQGWMYHANLLSLVAAKMCINTPLLFWGIFHCIDDLSSKKLLLRVVVKTCAIFSKNITGIVNNSHKSVIQHEKLGYVNKHVTVISNGIDTARFVPNQGARAGVCDELGIPDGSPLIGLIGRFDPLKDHSNFLSAASKVSRNYSGARFLLVGSGVDEGNSQLSETIEALGLCGKVFMLGERSDIPRLMAALDVSVSSSISEGTPVAIGESMACGIPCVVTNVGDSAALVGDCGLIVPPSDSEALAAAIVNLLSLTQDERVKMGLQSRARVKEHYSLESFVDRFEGLYNGVYS